MLAEPRKSGYGSIDGDHDKVKRRRMHDGSHGQQAETGSKPMNFFAIRRKSTIFFIILSLIFSISILLLFVKIYVEHESKNKTKEIISELDFASSSDENAAQAATRYVYRAMIRQSNSEMPKLLLRLRPYLTHRFLPPPFRIRVGAIDLMYIDLYCDNATRALGFILDEAGFETDQLNIVTPGNAHTALLARTPAGRQMLLDPYVGAVPVFNDNPIGPDELRDLAKSNVPADQIWRKLLPQTHFPEFYLDFANAVFATQGERLEMVSDVRLKSGTSLQLGTADGSVEDVIHEGNKARLTPHWHYIGNRYDRGWVRGLRFGQNTRVTFGLTDPPNARLVSSSKRPVIDQNKLIYEMAEGETLLFKDGGAGYDWLRLRSYQDVDFVRFDRID